MADQIDLGEDLKEYAWSELQELDKHVRYYGELASKYQTRRFWIQLVVFSLSLMGPAVLSLTPVDWQIKPLWILAPASLILPMLVAWDFIAGYANKAAILHVISLECDRIKSDQVELYHLIDNDRIPESEARTRLNSLSRRVIEATGRAGYAQVSFDMELNKKCWEDSKRVLMRQEA